MELPAWLRRWEQRRALEDAIPLLGARMALLTDAATTRATWIISAALIVVIGTLALLFWRSHLRQARAQEQFRNQLARDMHDEIGSNLAGIAGHQRNLGLAGGCHLGGLVGDQPSRS